MIEGHDARPPRFLAHASNDMPLIRASRTFSPHAGRRTSIGGPVGSRSLAPRSGERVPKAGEGLVIPINSCAYAVPRLGITICAHPCRTQWGGGALAAAASD